MSARHELEQKVNTVVEGLLTHAGDKSKAGLQGLSSAQLHQGSAQLEELMARCLEAGMTVEGSTVLQRCAALQQRMQAAQEAVPRQSSSPARKLSLFIQSSMRGLLRSDDEMRAKPTTMCDAALEDDEDEEDEGGGVALLGALDSSTLSTPRARPVLWGALLTGKIKTRGGDELAALEMRAEAWKPQFFVLYSGAAEQAQGPEDVRVEVFTEQFDPVAAHDHEQSVMAADSGRSRAGTLLRQASRSRAATLFSVVTDQPPPSPKAYKVMKITPDSLVMRSRLAPLALQLISPYGTLHFAASTQDEAVQWLRAIQHAARCSASWQHAIAFDFDHLAALDQFQRVVHREQCSLGVALKPVAGPLNAAKGIIVTESTEAVVKQVKPGSFLVAVNEADVSTLGGYEAVVKQLSRWRPPLTLTFLRPFKYQCTLNVHTGSAASIVWTSCEVVLDAGNLFYVPSRTREGRALSVMPQSGREDCEALEEAGGDTGPATQFEPSTGKYVLDPRQSALGKRASRVALRLCCIRKAHRREVLGRANCFVIVSTCGPLFMQAESREQRQELVGLLLRARQYETNTLGLARQHEQLSRASIGRPSSAQTLAGGSGAAQHPSPSPVEHASMLQAQKPAPNLRGKVEI